MRGKKYNLVSVTLLVVFIVSGCSVGADVAMRAEIRTAIEDLGSVDYETRSDALWTLGHHFPTPYHYLVARLDDENELRREGIIESLSRYRNAYPEKLKGLLTDDNPVIRAGAVWILAPHGNWDAAFLPSLLPLLEDEDESVRISTAISVAYMTDEPREIILGLLVKGVNSEIEKYREGAVKVLGHINQYPLDASPGFAITLGQQGFQRTVALGAFKLNGYHPVQALVSGLLTKDGSILEEAEARCQEIGYYRADPAPILAGLLYSDLYRVKRRAITEIKTLGPKAGGIVDSIIDVLSDVDPEIRICAAEALGGLGIDAALGYVPLLAMSLDDPDEGVREAASDAVGKLEPIISKNMDAIVDEVIDGLQPGRPKALMRSLWMIGYIGPDASGVVPALIELYENDISLPLKKDIAVALGNIGPGAKDAVPLLSVQLLEVDPWLVEAAGNALEAIGGDPVPHIVMYMSGVAEGHMLHMVMMSALAIDSDTRDVFPKLRAAALEAGNGNRAWTVGLERDEYPDTSYAISVMTRLLVEEQPAARYYGVFLLAVLAADPADVLPDILGMMDDPDEMVRAGTALALGYIGPMKGDATVDPLIELLDDESTWVKWAAVMSLGYMGSAAETALPKLREMDAEKIKTEDQIINSFNREIGESIEKIENDIMSGALYWNYFNR